MIESRIALARKWEWSVWLKLVQPYLLLCVISLPLLVWRLDTYPALWFDEGYKANAARTLAEREVYGTYTSEGYLPFDPGISSGPADIMPIALSFKLFGTGIIQARLVIVLYALLALGCFYAIASKLYGARAAWFSTLLLLTAPSIQGVGFVLMGRQVLGEMPSLALLLLGWWCWWQSWDKPSWTWSMVAGIALGLGLLSKTQIGLALAPAMMLVIAVRWWPSLQFKELRGQKRASLWLELTPLVVMLMVNGLWILLGRWVTPVAISQENSELLMDAIRSNLITGFADRTLMSSSWFIFAFMAFGVVTATLRFDWRPTGVRLATNSAWAEMLVMLFVACLAIWFAFISVGWPRYAFAGLMMSWLLVGKLGWDCLQWLLHQLARLRLGLDRYVYLCVGLGFGVMALVNLVYPLRDAPTVSDAQRMGDYIRATIPRAAVVESWEWELDALSGHWEFHHPHQHYLFLAIRQFSHERKSFDLGYDALQANPDYLIVGVFGDWTRIYDTPVVQTHFSLVAEFGPYRAYRRVYR
jgi:4-amino-4-deoxy-L-arabinose transferase-like glycosyltransferase